MEEPVDGVAFLLRNGPLEWIKLTDELPSSLLPSAKTLYCSAKGVRAQEEAREAGSFVRFLHALPTSCTELSVSDVELVSEEELSALCSAIGSPHCTLHGISIHSLSIRRIDSADADDAAQNLIRDALSNNTSLRFLSLYISDVFSEECVVPALSRTPCSIQQLTLRLPDGLSRPHDISELCRCLALNTISLTKLEVFGYFPHDSGTVIGTMLHSNKSIESLELVNCHLPGKFVKKLFASLEHNVHLTSLSLLGSFGPDWPQSGSLVLDCLRVNGTLCELNVAHTPLDGKDAATIATRLGRNKRKEKKHIVAVLEAEGSILVPSNTVRLFLCGLPFSGKTTLSRSLVRWNTGASNFAQCFSCVGTSMPKRTRGIEVSTLEKDGVKVSLWDMAGQPEYYAFHDQMFPDLSSDAASSLFLFVWSPIELHPSTGKEARDEHGRFIVKTLDMFEQEFRYWLRFITSKTLKSVKFKPILFVAITRADLVQFSLKNYIHNTFNRCQNDFQGHILFGMDGVFEINARDPSKMNNLALHIFHFVTSILESKPPLYEECNRARIALAQLVHSMPLAPLVTKEEFSLICKKHLGLDSIKMQEAVALSLNDSGDLIYFKALELVVMDTQWFCHDFMGDLLYFGSNTKQHSGFFSPRHLEDLLVSSMLVHYRKIFLKATRSPKIKGEALVKLLIGLQLACKRDEDKVNSDIFIPASLCTLPRRQVDPYMYLKGDEGNIETFMGRRLKCKDSICTFFTPGIFTLLQVVLNNTFNRVKVTLEEDVLAFSQDGVKVLIEFCKHVGQDHFIDVLFHSRLDLDNTIGWAQKELLDNMESICANPRGIQGVQLAYEVIRPRSVKEFVRMEERICAAVSIEDLRKILRDALEKRGTQPDCLKSVFYDWQQTNDSDYVVDLLGNVETLKVIKDYRQQFILDVEDVLNINVGNEVCSTSEPEKKVFSSSISGIERRWIYDELRGVHKEIQGVQKEISKLADDMNAFQPRIRQIVQELLTFSKEGEVGKLPRLFVVTKDDALVRKIVGAMVPGLENVRLELLCEHRSRPHLVTQQHGISFATLEDGLLKKGLPFINMFLKLAGMAVKVGAHVAAGLGSTVPDFSRLIALILDTPECPSMPTCLDMQGPGASRMNFQESQQWLFDVLSKHNCDTKIRIREVFGLYHIRYRDSHVAWLCHEHRSEGELIP